jgi:REP element-mobilizing transposase RayT
VEFWSDGYFVRSVGDEVTAQIIRNYIRYQENPEHDFVQLSLWSD